MAAVASQPNPSAYPSQLRANNPGRHRTAKYSDSGRLQHSPPSKTAILALHRYTNDRPSKCHCHRAPASGSQRLKANFSSHSFRIGAATSAAQKGLTKHQIQTLGRWSSEAFQSYIRTDQFHIKSAHQTLVS